MCCRLRGGLLGYFYSSSQDPVYEAKASILVQYRGNAFAAGTSDFRRSEELAATYSRLVTSSPFLLTVREDPVFTSNAGGFGSVSATTERNPPILNIRAQHRNPMIAATTAQVVAKRFIDYAIEQRLGEIARLQGAAAAQGISNVTDLVAAQFTALDSLSLLEPEVPTPGKPVIPRTRQNIILGSILGLIVAAAAVMLLESMRDTVRSVKDLNRRFGVSGLGAIFKWSPQEVEVGELTISAAPSSSYAEALRQTRANLQFASANKPEPVYLISSPGPGEGKTTLICNLAVAFAQSGKRVVVVDGDLRRPSVHNFFESMPREPGLSNYLAGIDDLEAVTHAAQHEGVHVLPSGPIPPNPAELLGSPRMSSLLTHLSKGFDLVLIDSPPLLVVADGSIIASQVDDLVMVVDGLRTRSSSLQAALDVARTTRVNVLGVVINKLKRSRFGYGYNYGYYYYYQQYYRYYSSSDDASVNGTEKWLRKSEQGDKWNRCLIEGMIVLSETGARDEQTTPP